MSKTTKPIQSGSPSFQKVTWDGELKLKQDRRYFFGTMKTEADLLPGNTITARGVCDGVPYVIIDIGSKSETKQYDKPTALSSLDRSKVLAPINVPKKKRGRKPKAPEAIPVTKTKGKRHRRTKAEMVAVRANGTPVAPVTKGKRHRRTKAEMAAVRTNGTPVAPVTKGKRHRRTKAEMLAARGK